MLGPLTVTIIRVTSSADSACIDTLIEACPTSETTGTRSEPQWMESIAANTKGRHHMTGDVRLRLMRVYLFCQG
jgi:hypothetical protein